MESELLPPTRQTDDRGFGGDIGCMKKWLNTWNSGSAIPKFNWLCHFLDVVTPLGFSFLTSERANTTCLREQEEIGSINLSNIYKKYLSLGLIQNW